MHETAIVLGGSAGIGRATVEALIARGTRVGVIARGEDRLEDLKREAGADVEVETADVADAAALGTAVAALIGRLGTAPTIWVNSAMLTSFSPFDQMGVDEFDRIVDVTFKGQVNGTRLALQHMREGTIVHVGSGLAYRSVPFQSAYCSAKSAIRAFVSSIRSELIDAGSPLTVTHILLPAVNTPQFDWARNRLPEKPQPAPPIYEPEVAVRGILHAIDSGAREVIVGRSVYQLLMGESVAPGVLDRMLAEPDPQMRGEDDPGGRPDNLHDPVAWDVAARGQFGSRASDSGLVVDADAARAASYGGAVLLAGGIGLALGLLLRRS